MLPASSPPSRGDGMLNLIPFNFNDNQIRVVDIDGQPWFLAADICRALDHTDTSVSVGRLDDDEKLPQTLFVSGQNRNVWLINESGLYSLILTSRKPEAKQFKKWVTAEVLPSIRKTGQYQAPAFQIPQTLPEALRLAADLADQVQQQQLMIEHQKPAVEFVERFVEARSAKSMREVAKVLGLKEKDFIARLLQEKILFRQSGSLLPFAGYQHKGYFTVKTGEASGHAYQQTRFTPLGISWISKRFGLIAGSEAL